MKRRVSRKLKPSRALIGTWRSDRTKTLEYWAFSKTASRKAKRMFRAKDFFGKLYWHVTRKKLTTWWPNRPAFESGPYRIIWENRHSVAMVFPRDKDKVLHHIVFADPDQFYFLSGKANCEWFKRVKSNKALERAARGRARALHFDEQLPRRPRAGAQRER